MAKRKSSSGESKSRGAGGGLSGLSVAELQREIARRQRQAGALHRRRDRLAQKLREVEAAIARLGGSGGKTGRMRFRNDKNLVDALHEVLKGKTMSVTQVAEAVQAAGYRTSSPSFRTIVNQTLIKSGKFSREGRGQYTAK